MAPLTPAGFLSDTQQVSLLHALNLPTIPSPTTPRRFDCLAWCHSRTYRHSDRSRLAAPVRQGIAGVSWASPWYGRLATTTGRIEFVILRTGLSPPDALHTPSRECSSDRLRGSSRTPTGTRTLLLQVTRNRTIPRACAWGFLAGGKGDGERSRSLGRIRGEAPFAAPEPRLRDIDTPRLRFLTYPLAQGIHQPFVGDALGHE